jgi:hypothetical protein
LRGGAHRCERAVLGRSPPAHDSRSLAWCRHLRYNDVMIEWRRLRLWFAAVLVVLLIVAVALWLRGTLPGSQRSPLPTPGSSGDSPLPTPSVTTLPPASSARVGATLLWVALGSLLALVITLVVLHWYRRAAI